jgi:hypothetical protein
VNAKWIRVTKKDRCKICGRHDWCDYSPELGLALCMRIESDRPSKNAMGGWLHRTGAPLPFIPYRKPTPEPPPQDFLRMWRRWYDATGAGRLDALAALLGVGAGCLRSLGAAWNGSAWAFPMRDAEMKVIGIRLRNDRGDKWAVKGSRQGLFIPVGDAEETLYVLEGPTDTAAALSLGLHAVGRPSCMGCEEMVKTYVRARRIKRTVIITDNDAPGLRGAERLKAMLPVLNCTYSPPCKDLREFVRLGGSRQLLEASIKDLVWQSPAGIGV